MTEYYSSHPFAPDIAEDLLWDVIVVGTGMGGATTGYELAKSGRRVLFIEKGKFLLEEGKRGGGTRIASASDDCDARLSRGSWPQPIQGITSFGDVEFFAPLGSGTGGSTSLFAAQLERMLPCDFEPLKNFPNTSSSTLPEKWPIEYMDFVRYYRLAEELYRVRGTPDPLNRDVDSSLLEPPALSERDIYLYELFREMNLNPYRAHVACEYVNGCEECGGVICPRQCKNDSGRICLMPALKQYEAKLLTECEALRFEADSDSIKSVVCKLNGVEISLKAKVFVLAAGALFSPILLLNSKSNMWPDGLANRSGCVGRNLMWHASDFIAIHLRKSLSFEGPKKALALNDFYLLEDTKLGTFQSVGVPITWPYVFSYLRTKFQKAPKWQRIFAQNFILRIVAHAAEIYFRNASIFATIIEDLPYWENRVVPDKTAKSGMRFEYKYMDELRDRGLLFRKKLSLKLREKKCKTVILSRGNNINFGHACGTCRFGTDPTKSVLNDENRAHDVENLYITDASFFPSSGGTNPSLTIAANAIRVAETINMKLCL